MIFVLDASGSLDEANFIHVRNFVSSVVSELEVDSGKIRVGVVTYSDYAEPRFNLIQYNTRYALNTFSIQLTAENQ